MESISRWGPYTNMGLMREQGPLVIDHADGIYVWDEAGTRYLDAHAGLWLANVGYGRAEIIDAISRQAQKLSWFSSFGGFANRPSMDLADRLTSILKPDGMASVFFSNDGSEAMETALKITRQYWKLCGKETKTKFIGRQYAYHGVTAGALSVAGITANRRMFEPLLPDVRHAPAPYRNHCSFHPDSNVCTYVCVNEVERIIRFEDPSTVAAFVVEPIQAAGGVIIPPRDYLSRVQAICRHYRVLLIVDEVVTGFGRLGAWTGSRYYGVEPDIMTFAKGITSGYLPLGATAVSAEILNTFISLRDDGPELRHGNTYSGHPLAAVAALANLEIMERENLLTRSATMGDYLSRILYRLADHFPELVVDVGSVGLLGRVEFRPQNEDRVGALGATVASRMLKQGVIVRPAGDVITLSPPLIINTDELDEIVGVMEHVLSAI